MRKRKSVDSPSRVQHYCQTSVLYWLNANQLPTRLANYRHLGCESFIVSRTQTPLAL